MTTPNDVAPPTPPHPSEGTQPANTSPVAPEGAQQPAAPSAPDAPGAPGAPDANGQPQGAYAQQPGAYPQQGYPQPGAPAPYGAPAKSNKEKKGLAIATLCVGAFALLGAWIPFVNFGSMFIALVAIVLGIIALVKFGGRVLAIVGLALAALAIVVALVINFVVGNAIVEEVERQDQALAEASAAIDDTLATYEDEAAADPVAEDDALAALEEALADAGAAPEGGTAAFGEVFEYTDGIAVSVTAPAEFTPGEYAYGTDGEGTPMKFEVTLVNGSSENFDAALLTEQLSSAGTSGEFIADEGIDGYATGTVLPGKSLTYTVGYMVADPADVQVEVSPGWDYDAAIFVS